jgi:hypothetical protein
MTDGPFSNQRINSWILDDAVCEECASLEPFEGSAQEIGLPGFSSSDLSLISLRPRSEHVELEVVTVTSEERGFHSRISLR